MELSTKQLEVLDDLILSIDAAHERLAARLDALLANHDQKFPFIPPYPAPIPLDAKVEDLIPGLAPVVNGEQTTDIFQYVLKEKKRIKHRLGKLKSSYNKGASAYVKRRNRRKGRKGYARRSFRAHDRQTDRAPIIGPLYTDKSLGNLTLRRQDLKRRVQTTPVWLGWNFLTDREGEELQVNKIYEI